MKISSVFELPVAAECLHGNNGWWTVEKLCGNSIDESADGGFEEDTAKAVAHAINTHDRMKDLLQQAAGRVVISQASTEELEWLADTIDVLGGDI